MVTRCLLPATYSSSLQKPSLPREVYTFLIPFAWSSFSALRSLWVIAESPAYAFLEAIWSFPPILLHIALYVPETLSVLLGFALCDAAVDLLKVANIVVVSVSVEPISKQCYLLNAKVAPDWDRPWGFCRCLPLQSVSGKKGPFLLSSSTYTCTVTCTTFRTILVWMLQTRYLVCWKQSKAWFFQGRTVVLQRLLKTIIKLIPFTFFCFARHGELLLQGKGKPAQEHQIIQAAAG